MEKKYWLDLFTGKTWEEFLKSGATVTGFRERRKKLAQEIHPGDYLLCYLTGISRFVAVLNVKSECYYDKAPIWKDEDFPVRFDVEMLYRLKPETAVQVLDLRENLSIFKDLKSKNAWSGFFRGSPALFTHKDGEIIVEEIKKAATNPIIRPYDKRKYRRTPKTYETKAGLVTVPDEDTEEQAATVTQETGHKHETTHEEIQWLLLKLGSELGLSVWVARNDRNKSYSGNSFADILKLRNELPRQFDPATNKTIELIDVLWLQGDAIIAAFEVEHTSSIYSGLLRMSDLISMQPNIKLDLYIVAPDERREKVRQEINRPTFAKLRPSLPKICKFIPYSELKSEIEQIGYRIRYMKPEFIQEMAESCELDEA
jgi:predicted RNA-binding protein